MSRVFDRAITIQTMDEETEKWTSQFEVHAYINTTKTNDAYFGDGASRSRSSLTFEVRYFKELEDVALNLNQYRILFNNVPYRIDGYDDYKLQHKTVRLLGVSEYE